MEDLNGRAGLKLEQNYVRSTYDNIAEEFSNTRYKKWPKVESFLKDLPKGSLLLDVGCGNGKYLGNETTFNIGCDASSKLLSICKDRQFEVVHCDMMQLPFKPATFDAVICIAALHHIVTARRRQKCLEDMISLLSDSQSKLLVQVWSYEQELDKVNPYLRRNRMKLKASDSPAPEEVLLDDKIKIPVHINRTPFKSQDLLVPFHTKRSESATSATASQDGVSEKNLRYYHVFKENELDLMLEHIPRAKILESYYDMGNWCSIITKTEGDEINP